MTVDTTITDPHVQTAGGLSRRTLLASAAVTSAAVALAGCGGSGSGSTGTANGGATTAKGSAKTPLPTPASFNESPKLAELVKAKTLPAVADRLPAVPYVIPHNWTKRGNYGGSLKVLVGATSGSDAGSIANYFYGYTVLRLLNDGTTIGPGVAEKWESNADTSEWTFHFRKGLKWSDGHPWSTADIMFWWNDMANNADYIPESVPDECKSGKKTIAKITAPDEFTLKVSFDTPAPLFPAKIASYSRGYRGNGASWMVPSHFVKQFHKTYNKNVPSDWAGVGRLWETNADYKRNPKCPTLAGFRLAKYSEGRSLTWERNPYYCGVTRDGDQLPYIDTLLMTSVQDPQVGKVQITAGKVDYSHGPFNSLALSDVSTLKKAQEKSGIEVLLWDTGSGTASMMFLNQDYKDPVYRKLFHEPKFRQALSLAFNREEAKKAIYFQQGEPSTGTSGPKGAEFVGSDEGQKLYLQWRDSYVKFDPDGAKKLLDEIGVVDTDGDGLRELPGGAKLKLRIDIPADAADEHKQKDAQLVRDWKAVGLLLVINPVAPTSFGDNWANGSYMIHSDWEVSGPPNTLLGNPGWLVPIQADRWAPMQGAMYSVRGTPAEKTELDVDPYKRKPPRIAPEAGGPIDKLWKLLDQASIEPDELKRQKLVFEICKIHVTDGPFFQGTVANAPAVEVHKVGLNNVPTRDNLALGGMTNPYGHPTPAVYDPESFFWDKPADHTI
ncbi:MAG TPA: ABC transporter substrate-binding protein [Actinopolymorphaceae bacterium]|jgi:peptide/nickel transport system substrate-binding protein